MLTDSQVEQVLALAGLTPRRLLVLLGLVSLTTHAGNLMVLAEQAAHHGELALPEGELADIGFAALERLLPAGSTRHDAWADPRAYLPELANSVQANSNDVPMLTLLALAARVAGPDGR